MKMLMAAVLAVLAMGALTLTGSPAAQADPLPADPLQPDLACIDDSCLQPAPAIAPPPIRGVLGCVRGVCIPKPH
ncbi:hypothetical protein, partial [Mycobacterium asiaticum]|uniref:hypothetical protein n=1 Tax=Mycobacterium asiaticum TaxID=1790 RepID=UPI001C12B400